MTKPAAIHAFWSSFGWAAYNEASVPDGDRAPNFPYITYQNAEDSFGHPVLVSASLWNESTSWIEINRKSEEISAKITRAGVSIPCDDGSIWIKRGHPFSQSLGDEASDLIKRKILNIEIEFLTNN